MIEDFSLDKEFDEEIDLTPLIDVVFILLIFFFITSTFIQPSLPVNLAKAASASASTERKEQLVITIDADGTLFHEGMIMAREEIPSLIRANPDLGINLFVDRAAPFESFLSVIDETRLMGRDDVSITTLPVGRE
ncbi:MAG: biopolymer transporter ExbD [Kiritimatiellaeota bacterium]|nr:biopolymer transporter ExbD [Kiritimatiellota bacterium]